MNGGKGKGRANGAEDVRNPATTEQPFRAPSSILQRVVTSASALSQSALAPPNGKELMDHASKAPGSSGKGQQPRGSDSSVLAKSSRASDEQSSSSSSRGGLYLPFKKDHKDQHCQDSETEFSSFLDGIRSFTPPANSFQQSHLGCEPFRDPAATPFVREYTAGELKGGLRYMSVGKQRQNDGADVLAILSAPGVTADSLAAYEEDAIDSHLTQEHRLTLLAKMKGHDDLDQLPSIVLGTGSFTPLIGNIEEESHFYFGRLMEREEAQQAWTDKWGPVLTRYTDEVWGDLLPLVKEAREEVKAMKEDPHATIVEQSKALRRLGLILSQLRES